MDEESAARSAPWGGLKAQKLQAVQGIPVAIPLSNGDTVMDTFGEMALSGECNRS